MASSPEDSRAGSPDLGSNAPSRRMPQFPVAIVGAVGVAGLLLVAAGLLVFLRPGPQPRGTGELSAWPPVPNVIGLTAAEAEERLAAAGYALEETPGEISHRTDAVLRQSPLPGWGDFRHGLVRVTFVWRDDFGHPLTLPASSASAAIAVALQRASAERPGVSQVVELQPLPEPRDSKEYRCEPGRCAVIHVNGGEGGGYVLVDPGRAAPVVAFTWYATPWPPYSVFSEAELVEAAVTDPAIALTLQGRRFHGAVKGGGDSEGICRLPNGVATCATVVIQVSGAPVVLVSVNYVTLAVRFQGRGE